jgi:hypothetical protein
MNWMFDKNVDGKLRHTGGAKGFRWRLQASKGNEGRLGGLITKSTFFFSISFSLIMHSKVEPKLINKTWHYKRTISPNQCEFELLNISIWSWFIESKADFLVNMK